MMLWSFGGADTLSDTLSSTPMLWRHGLYNSCESRNSGHNPNNYVEVADTVHHFAACEREKITRDRLASEWQQKGRQRS